MKSNLSKTLTIAAGVLLLGTLPVISRAQDNSQVPATAQSQTAPAHGDKMPRELANLNLTDDQKAQVKKIHEDMRAQMDATQNDSTLSADQKMAKTREIRHAGHKQVVALLTPEQRAQMKQDKMARHANHQQNTPPAQQAPPQQ